MFIYLHPQYKEIKNKGLNSAKSYSPWNSTAKPSWFLIVSDLHLGTIRPNSYEKVFLPLSFGINTYHPQKIIIPGDLTDNYDGKRLYPYKNQMLQDWELYKTLLHNLNISLDKIIQVRGNHDSFKIAEFDSNRHYGKDLFNYHNESDFHFQVFHYQTESGLFKFVLINPYHFPIGPICFTALDAFPTNKYYEKLNSILQTNDSDITFLVTHYPAIAFSPSRKIYEIYSKSPNQRVVIAGHWHKRMNTKVMHHGPTLELIISGIVKSNHIINILTIDNKRVINHQIDITKADHFLLTNPVPYKMNTGNGFFNQGETEIRVLTFSDNRKSEKNKLKNNDQNQKTQKSEKIISTKSLNFENDDRLPVLKFSISDKNSNSILNGQLNCDRLIEPSVRLCTFPLNLSDGLYTLTKSGDWSGQTDFFIGNHIPPFYDNPPDCLPIWEWYYMFAITAFFFGLVLVPLPSEIERALSKSRIAAYEENEKESEMLCKKDSLFLGFFTLHGILFQKREIPSFLSFSLFFSYFYVIFLPLSFFEIEGKIGIIFSWGYVCGKKVLWHFFGGEIGLRSIYFIIAPVVFLTAFFDSIGISTFSIVVSILYFVFNLKGYVSMIYKLIDMSGVFFTFTSPVIYLPLLLYFVFLKWLISNRKKRYQLDFPTFDLL